jgi:hypothetical protein
MVDARRVATEVDARTSAINAEVQRLDLTRRPSATRPYVALVSPASAQPQPILLHPRRRPRGVQVADHGPLAVPTRPQSASRCASRPM